jgi:hypothetical protein
MELLIDLERRFWRDGADFFRQQLTDDFLMLFPGTGMMRRAEAIDGVAAGQRWDHVEIHDAHTLVLGPDARLLCYQAEAERNGEGYSALVSSAYVRRDGTWKLAFHQQSPIG